MPPITPAKKQGKTFQNPVPTAETTEGFGSMLWKYMTSKEERVPARPIGPFTTDATIYTAPPATGVRITWMGHSSLLIEVDGKRLLTDPVWGPRASFSKYVGPKRFFSPPIALQHLPPLDGIIISHDHYDHLDYPTMRQLVTGSVPIFCPLGVGAHLLKWGMAKSRITELDWGDTAQVGDLSITATPARHFSGRGIVNRNQTLWASFVLKGPQHTLFYGADSGWFPGFADIGESFGPFDLTMLEIGAYGSGWPDIHMGPDHAANAHKALRGKLMMPIHWGTFNLALHAWREPVERLLATAGKQGIPLFLPVPGTPTEVAGPHNSGWWV